MPVQDGVGVHLGELDAAVARHPAGYHRQVLELTGGVLPAVRLHDADDDIGAAGRPPPALAEHVDGLADPRGRAQVHPQPAPGRTLPGRGGGGWGGHGGLFSAMPGSSSRGGAELLQGQVQFQHVDPFLADETEGPALDVGVDQVTHLVRWQPTGVRDPVDLQQGVGGADVRVEPGARRR